MNDNTEGIVLSPRERVNKSLKKVKQKLEMLDEQKY